MRPLNLRSTLRKSVLALALVGVIGGIATAPASAEEWRRHEGYGRYEHDDWRAREWRAREWREHRYYRDYDGPRVVYGAPRYYAPPFLSFGFDFR